MYRAHDAVLAREVAIKVLHRNLAGDPGFIDRFRREARSAAYLNHPNIVAVYDWGASDGVYFMVMEYVRGRNVRELLSAIGRLEPAQATVILLQVLSALEHAHRQGIVHRDVKPENMLVTTDGMVKVADFGLARAYADMRSTQSGMVTGTVQYLAPEQIQGRPAEPRTDIYAFGVVAYELLTGRTPFEGEISLSIAYQHLSERIPAPSLVAPAVSEELDRIVLHATEKAADDRPATAQELRRKLVSAAKTLPPARPISGLIKELPGTDQVGPERAQTITIPESEPGHRKRRPWLRKLILWIFALGVAAAAAWAVWTYLVPHTTTVPRVIGVSVQQARARLDSAGLDVVVGKAKFSDDVAEGKVVGAEPGVAEEIDRGTEVVLHPSKGPAIVDVPRVAKLSFARARSAIAEANLELGDVRHHYSDTVKKNEVISQSPRKGTAESGSPVHLVVSKGPAPVRIPGGIEGHSVTSATSLLQSLGLEVQRVDQYSERYDFGIVMRAVPPPGTRTHRGESVTLYVSKGPERFMLPDVTGMSASAAEASLEARGLLVTRSVVPNSSGATVVSTDPKPETTVSGGDRVTIFVA